MPTEPFGSGQCSTAISLLKCILYAIIESIVGVYEGGFELNANGVSMTITSPKRFLESVEQASEDRDSLVCIGLDPDLSRIPDSIAHGRSAGDAIFEFNKHISAVRCSP